MNRIIKKAGILIVVFLAAVLVWFFSSRQLMEQDETIYVVMDDASLPIVTVEMLGRTMNRMPGYCQDMGSAAAGDSLTVLPEDRMLPVHIAGSADGILGLSYEIRSLDLARLVENTRVESWETEDGGIVAKLPIQNLLTKDREYLLRIQLDTEQHGPVYYYTRIVWTDAAAAQSMVDMAVDFSEKTFDYDQAKSLVRYLETDNSEDNSTFGHTGIRSGFSQLTWGKLAMQPTGPVQTVLKELDGAMSCVELNYLASRTDENGETEYYDVKEAFTMKWSQLRIYLMDYDRTVNQIFQGRRSDYSGKRLMLGIMNEDQIDVKRSPNRKIYAFRVNRELWSYAADERSNRAVKVFSFRGDDRNDARENDSRHDIRLLQVDDDGSMDFLVYGYMSRGNHEGQLGIAGYRYEASDNALEELFFIPAQTSFEELAEDLNRLAYLTEGDMLYLMAGDAVYGIDLKSRENMVVADALREGSYAVSADFSRIAWQDGGELYRAGMLHLMDLETGEKRDIRGESGEYVRTLGFVGRDLVYGTADEADFWMVNGRVENLPMHTIRIINDRMQEETSYEKSGYYVSEVQVEESRIHLKRVVRTGDGQYAPAQEDTIICNADMGPGKLDGIGWYASQDKGKLYFVQLDQEVKSGRSIHLTVPRKVSFDRADTLELRANDQLEEMIFYAYGGGRLLGTAVDFHEAVELAYAKMGIVTDRNHQILWSRVNRGNIRNIRDPLAAFEPVHKYLEESECGGISESQTVVLDARGCSLTQILYFIDRGIPVKAYTDGGSWLLLCGFDQYNVTVYDPETGETYKAGLNDSTEYFRVRGNDFICAVQLP